MKLRAQKISTYTTIVCSLFIAIILAFLFFARVDQTITVYGRIEPDKTNLIRAPKDGIIEKVYIEDGDFVNVGDTLLLITNPDEELNYQKLCLELEIKERELEQLKSNLKILECGLFETQVSRKLIPQIEVRYQRAKRKYEIAQALYEKQYISQDEFEEVRTNYNVTSSSYQIAKNETALQQKTNRKCINEKTKEIGFLRTEISVLVKHIANSFVLSQNQGYALFENDKIDEGSLVLADKPLLTITESANFHFVSQIDEKYIPQIKLGQDTQVFLNAYPVEKYQFISGTVVNLKSDPREARFKIKVDLVCLPENIRLLPGMTGRAKIVVLNHKRIIEQILSLGPKGG